MKIYVAGRYKKKEDILKVYATLESLGHSITYKWTEQESIKPFVNNKKKAQEYIKDDFNGIKTADTIIIFPEYEPDARGCYIELGYALHETEKRDLNIFVVLKDNNPSMFFMSEKIKLVKSFEEVLKELS